MTLMTIVIIGLQAQTYSGDIPLNSYAGRSMRDVLTVFGITEPPIGAGPEFSTCFFLFEAGSFRLKVVIDEELPPVLAEAGDPSYIEKVRALFRKHQDVAVTSVWVTISAQPKRDTPKWVKRYSAWLGQPAEFFFRKIGMDEPRSVVKGDIVRCETPLGDMLQLRVNHRHDSLESLLKDDLTEIEIQPGGSENAPGNTWVPR